MSSGERDATRPSFEVGLRRVPELDPSPLPESEPRLVARITDEIRASGPMTFARFMELALYDADAGYYTSAESDRSLGPGRRGDFLTAPESHPIFGWAVARHLESVWVALDRPARFVIREHGAGAGALAAGILDGLRRTASTLLEAVRYQAIDVAPARLGVLMDALGEAGLDRYVEPADDLTAPGAILANELLDALPVHRVEGGPDGHLLERFVVLADRKEGRVSRHPAGGEPMGGEPMGGEPMGGEPMGGEPMGGDPMGEARTLAFATRLGPPSTSALAERLASEGVNLEPGQPAEISLAIDDWIARAAKPLERGAVLLIDYGYPAPVLYRPERSSTLRAYHRHHVHADPLVAIGRQDLTAHVDLTAVERAAVAAGLVTLGRARQAEFLAALGIGQLLVALQADPATTFESYLEARSALVRMLDPRATGAFSVLAFGRGLPQGTSLRGFA